MPKWVKPLAVRQRSAALQLSQREAVSCWFCWFRAQDRVARLKEELSVT